MIQTPATGDFLLKWRGDVLSVTLRLDHPRKGRAAFRTNIGRASVRREEIIDETERGRTPLARAWTDIPLDETEPGVWSAQIPLDEVGIFSGKACFFAEGSHVPEWPEGSNTHIKVESALVRGRNSIYTVFPRQFGSFREIVRRLPVIMDTMGFRILQTLPPFPIPTTYAVMGEYGSPFAATDFLSVDPSMAEFDEYSTPLMQFKELIGSVHAHSGLMLLDLPANHTGWASTLQTHHPDWFHRAEDGRFISPGAWGVTWADLVELDYANPRLRAYMAEVFLFWCRVGVDGFRCDAGYMIPAETWEYIVAKVREEYPDTVFMLEGLGGKLEVTDRLLAESNLDWAYSEIFQTYDRNAFEWYLPSAIARSEKYGTLVHFAETHDNDRLAKNGTVYARLRVKLAALLSWQGAWGIANGVEWYCKEKIDVHRKNDLNWGAQDNMVEDIAKLNSLISWHPTFFGTVHQQVVTRGDGNTLAVLRIGENDERLLVLANLDCGMGASIDWNRALFGGSVGYDLLTSEPLDIARPVALNPGEVKAISLVPPPQSPVPRELESPSDMRHAAIFHITMPQDAKRDVVVPGGQWVEMRAHCQFRVRVVDPTSGKTLRVFRSIGRVAKFSSPEYVGDGTACRKLELQVTLYEPNKVDRKFSRLLVPPPSDLAKVRVELTGDEVREHPEYRTILANGSGACSQIRIGWGQIFSQYDAILAANPNPSAPSDRINIWTRTRCWLRREGYVRELDRKCITRFAADPGGRLAKWEFTVPCGMGRETRFVQDIALVDGENTAVIRITRVDIGKNDIGDRVRLVLRPDLEWRSFHATTKAFKGPEQLFASSCRNISGKGLTFHPYGDDFVLSVKGGEYHHEPQWIYNVGHPEELARGQDSAGDLFSPGWISADLAIGESVEVIGALNPKKDERMPEWGDTCIPATGDFVLAFKRALMLYIAHRSQNRLKVEGGRLNGGMLNSVSAEETKEKSHHCSTSNLQPSTCFSLSTVLAGYPWFLDWGRDTFIFMRGMIAAGMLEESLDILTAFAEFEENGTLPNIIYGDSVGNRDTTDAQLWFINAFCEISEKVRKLRELRNRLKVEGGRLNGGMLNSVSAVGTKEKSHHCSTSNLQPSTCLSNLSKVCESIIDNYIKGTPNGIKVDPESGLVWSPSHFTWMDTNYPACTPRVGYPVEIQALWIRALKFFGRDSLAEKARQSVISLFKAPVGYYDCLAAPNGEPASQAKPEDTIRPNQLFLLSLGILDDRSILEATEQLLVPGAIRTLNHDHPLYRGVYAGDEDTSRKPAYHNGTAWAWVFPSYVEAMVAAGVCDREVGLQLLAGSLDNINSGCVGHVSEIADGDAPHAAKGCAAQAWSDSELLRVWLMLSDMV